MVGLTTAQALLTSGHRVTLVERGQVGQEASWAGGGILSPLCPWDYGEPVTRLALRSMGMFGDATNLLKDATGIDPEYQRCGLLLLPPYQQGLAEQWCARHDLTLHSVALSDHLPADASSKSQGSGLLLPGVAQVRNPRLIKALTAHVRLLGGVILEQHEVHAIDAAGDRVTGVLSTRGKLEAEAYIVAAGAWSKRLLGQYSLSMDVRPIRGQIVLFKFTTPPFRQILLKDDLYLIPRRDGHVLVGSTLEDVGFDRSVTVTDRDDLMRRVCEIFPEWHDREPLRHWFGFRPGSPGNVPIIGRHPRLTNLYANTGHFRYGVTMSLASAELLCNEINGAVQPLPVGEYDWR